jgi:DNA (cytosine-5)-methyltransferase 1
MKVLSLFSGVGGFDIGLENAGMETVFQCEWDKHANSILHRHWPDVPKWDDVSTLTGKHILANAPEVDVVAWGSPCQDLSVAGKRAGLEGGRSGLFHEGIRIIKELQEETNGQYPRISIWENVVGALNSNRGADFGVILNEMAEAGSVAIEWAVLDAQYFGVPQRRRRVFVIAIFDPVLAERSPSPLLPVAESLPGHLAKGKPKRQSFASETAASFGTDGKWWDGRNTAEALTTTSNEQRMPDKQRFQAVVETNPILIDRAAFNQGENAQYEPYISDHPIVPSLVSTGPHAVAISEPMLLDIQRVGDIRVYSEPVQSLQARMGTGGNSTPMLAFDTQFGSNANVTEDVALTLKASQQSPSVAYPIDTRNALRDPEKYDAQNRQGLGIGNDGDPMATLTSAHVNGVAVQYDGYNQRVNETDVSLTIRIGRDSSDFIAQPTEPTMAVRRLTPLECERLMGWPDNHTLTKADGTTQADTHRYKQCGNGVASPVAQWIAKHLLNI